MKTGMKQRCVCPPGCFIFYVGVREVEAISPSFLNRENWNVMTCFYADHEIVIANSEKTYKGSQVNSIHICKYKKLKANVIESKVMVYETRQYDLLNFEKKVRAEYFTRKVCTLLGLLSWGQSY